MLSSEFTGCINRIHNINHTSVSASKYTNAMTGQTEIIQRKRILVTLLSHVVCNRTFLRG